MTSTTMTLKQVKTIRNRAVRSLNNQYVLAGLVVQSLKQMRKDLKEHEQEDSWEFEVPDKEGDEIALTRDYDQVSGLLKTAYSSDIFKQFMIAAITVVEDYLQNMLRLFLAAYPKKLGVSAKGVEVERKIPLDIILTSSNKDDIVSRVIDLHLNSLFYAKPLEYFAYIEDTLDISIPEAAKANYIEAKATRDIIVHNSGIANEMYAQKAAKKARAKPGEALAFDEQYFKAVIGTMKLVVSTIYDACVKKYHLA
jgi:hypothetical protein